MPEYQIEGVGTARVDKNLECDFSVTSDEFFERFQHLVADLPAHEMQLLKGAIDGKRQKIKKEQASFNAFFEKVQAEAAGTYGESPDEAGEHGEIEALKEAHMDAGAGGRASVDLVDRDRATPGIETYDADTGKVEGQIVLGPQGDTGKLVPLRLHETISTHQTHEGEEIPEDVSLSGTFQIENVSETDRLWDIDVTLADIEKTGLESTAISLQELDPGEVHEQTYTIQDEGQRHVAVREFISTLDDPETPSFALSVSEESRIFFRIELEKLTDAELRDVRVVKTLQQEFANVEVVSTSAGKARFDEAERQLVWEIPEIVGVDEGEAEGADLEGGDEEGGDVEAAPAVKHKTVTLEFRAGVSITDINARVGSGPINVMYTAASSISGVKVEKFDAFTNNRFFIEEEEKDDEPDNFRCQLIFQNTSEFIVRLVNADVWDPADDTKKFVDIDPADVPPIPAGASWHSNIWEYYAESGEPVFKQKCLFFVVSDHDVTTTGTLAVDDVELAVASIEGVLAYDVKALPSFRETEFHVTHEVTNTGGAELNEVVVQETIQEKFRPPAADQVQVLINDEEIELGADAISIEPADQESSPAHVVRVQLLNLKETGIESFKPGDVLKVTYPIVADKPERGVVFTSDVLYQANTDPAGAPLEVVPEAVEIPVEHIRKKLRKGKEIRALAETGKYQITLFFLNTGEYAVPKVTVRDKVPDNFEYSEMSVEPQITDLEGEDVLEWTFEDVQPNEKQEITYVIAGSGEYRASDAQFTM
ncbi:MAG: hypothetical protein Kow0069_24410 [Promethearchaeota archaeon]